MRERITFVFVVFFFYFSLNRFGTVTGLEAVKGMYVFGDSLVDVGNNDYLTVSIAKANYPHNGIDFPGHIPTGRFSNGKNAADLIAERLGIASPPPYLSLSQSTVITTGVNFASAGAGIFNSSDQTLGQSISLSQQVNYYISVHRELENQLQPSDLQNILSKSIFAIVIGSNDLFDYFGSFSIPKNQDPRQYTQSMANKLKEQLKRLHDNGARKFLVVGVAQIGCTPRQRAGNSNAAGCNEESNMWSSVYNEALTAMLQELEQELNGSMSYSYFDNFKVTQDIFSKPTAYGFTDVEAACCGLGELNADVPCVPIAEYCTDRTQYFFWDLYGHPTEAAARSTVDLMFSRDTPYSFPLTLNQLLSLP